MTKPELSKSTVLIVDDQEHNRVLLKDFIIAFGFQPLLAKNGESALEILENDSPDLVLLDILMPGMSGLEVLEKIKQNPDFNNTPVIMITALDSVDSVVHCLTLGAEDYLVKPFNSKVLWARIKNALEKRHYERKLNSSNTERLQLLHILSHDLANPLLAISMYSQLLPQDNAMHKGLLDCSKQCVGILNLVRNFLVLESKNAPLDLKRTNLNNCLELSCTILEPRFKEKQISLVTNIASDIEVLAEEISLTNSVITNILTNALKFSARNSKIHVNAVPLDDQVCLTIKDAGIGMPEEIRKNLFIVRKQSKRFGTEGEKGTGFGMPLLKKFLDAYGATIEVTTCVSRQILSTMEQLLRFFLSHNFSVLAG